MARTARTIQVAARPDGMPKAADFRLAEVDLPDPGPGEVLLRTMWISLDPYMRGLMSESRSYAQMTPLGHPLPCEVVACVLSSNDASLTKGDQVLVYDVWRDRAVRRASDCRKLDPARAPVQAALGVLGMPGRTAYSGLKHIGQPKPGETLVVGAATGAVGSVVGQISRLQGARVIGIAGGEEKCRYAVETLGFDACLDRRVPDLGRRLGDVCRDGIDVYFELTGGDVFSAVMPLLNDFARVPVCGTIASYNSGAPPPGPDRLPGFMRLIQNRRLTLRGFNVDDFSSDIPEFETAMSAWLRDGSVRSREDISRGIESVVSAFIGMLEGRNFGKTLVCLD
ncbi:NADP-dependent oxidoreductase [Frigidibacter sp. RF13]|uniref:NADP-dependent oxidoreductase n=1 Tax=Frigidibacter sp. RF13 TaxID=2997340 RepID=UPI00226FBA64|nr:NADP-dependent oxidoreductase [Frigidibacter sp. RF13]MCY1127050.1 NADP-dependent oxidoreductase [Frigidibacter sp. RF13]